MSRRLYDCATALERLEWIKSRLLSGASVSASVPRRCDEHAVRIEFPDGGRLAATRRAIVMAAAGIVDAT